MKKDCAKTLVSPALRRVRERNVRTPATPHDGPTRTIKRKAKKTLKKTIRVPKTDHPNTSRGDVDVRGVKRTRLDLVQHDMETASCSADTESCNTSVDVVSKRGVKRKAVAAGEGPCSKRGKSDLKEAKADLSVAALTERFKAKYMEQDQLGQGGCGSVFAGYRRADNLPVAIKHVPKDKILCKVVDQNGKQLSVEVAIMLKLAAGTGASVGMTAPVALLDWYDLDQELILVLERPVPSKDLLSYIEDNGGPLPEEQAKIILTQLIEAAMDLENHCVFHRDIKVENILIETGSDVPRLRLIDFGLSCFARKGSFYRIFYGTASHIPPEWYSHCMYRPSPTTVWQLGVVLFEMLHRDPFETTKFLGNKLRISKKLSKNCQDLLRMSLTETPQQRLTLEQLQLHPWLR
ncbi:serine/threonine-protein kinase pim-1-like [Etheostoma cragini]|uniref:serine/threonine-protein kinase pim-1-like n=1 Tax=Etheostoma cragini TaxID=417921 RepID=UPI00155F2384|nr:serine/threonine-protein kinase pim-1-like [Etheostoma cragini]